MRRKRIVSFEDDEIDPLYGSTTMQEQNVKAWNKFQIRPREQNTGSTVESTRFNSSIKIIKCLTITFVFLVVLGSAIISKGTMLFMASQLKRNLTRPYCNRNLDTSEQYSVKISQTERLSWTWMLVFAYFVPELGTFVRSLRICCFKTWKTPSFTQFLSLFLTECCSAVGSAILIFQILPELDVVKGAMLTNAVCFIPAVLNFFSRKLNSVDSYPKIILDIFSIVGQASCVVWPLIEANPVLYLIPVAVLLISVGWWENFVSMESPFSFIRNLGKTKLEFKNDTYFLYIFVSLLKCVVFFLTVFVIFWLTENKYYLFSDFEEIFQSHSLNVSVVEQFIVDNAISYVVKLENSVTIRTDFKTLIWAFFIHATSTYICYVFGKFSCKVLIQNFGFAFPVNLAMPILISILIAFCGLFSKNECFFSGFLPEYLFFNSPPLYDLKNFIVHQHSYMWLIWLFSQVWITVHIWTPVSEKLANTEKIFLRPLYDAFLIDQSLALNRKRSTLANFLEPERQNGEITRIYACATMWHEEREEMVEFLKSIFRLDEDQCAHRIVRTYLQYNLPTYYELETHIFFDDAFIRKSQTDNDPHLNIYVNRLISAIDKAAYKVHETPIRLRPPKIYPTPYGGRLIWTLPGKTRLIAHLKDKKKIRNKKRWSQVMYMYYLLGYKLMDNDQIPPEKKDIVAENTYLLALDGDIDFQPEAVHLLVDYMKKNRSLGAACGRIHPIGNGTIAWYQMFEYAVGHWMQKATEHVIGCVLCSPGCFSLFRGQSLMDYNVMRKYTTTSEEAIHYVQYDQGEDRWLCTLLLQRGYRVEYSAASDAYTHCPEGFNEFYNQRRRWIPSTMANIIDLLMDYKYMVKMNNNISKIYVFYQTVLLIGTVLGPGTIFLMLVGAFVTVFKLDQWSSFYWNMAPIVIFVTVCMTCKSEVQLFFAGLFSAIYGLVMMAVLVGVMLQINYDGFLAPSSLFFFCIALEMVIAALLHPKEFYCLKYGIIYYVTVPSMYMLLIIYSVFNMNNVSWGTREVTVASENGKPEQKPKKSKIMSYFGDNFDNEGSIELSLNKLFKCMFCTYQKEDNDTQLEEIQTSLEVLIRKIEQLEGKTMQPTQKPIKEEEVKNVEIPLKSDEIIENSWFYDEAIVRGEVYFLDDREEKFWNELLDEYLFPIEDDKKKVEKKLKDLRDKVVFTFFMLNCLFVLVVFLLTLEKDTLHINWPFEPKINFTYYRNINEIHITRTYLQLEPIGFVFLIFFAFLLIIQFTGMLIHRFGTFSQIITNTKLEINLFNKNVKDLSAEEVMMKDPLEVARDLQQLKGINEEDEEIVEEPADRRKTVHNLANKSPKRFGMISSLDKAFHSRIKTITEGQVSEISETRRKSVAFVNRRRAKLHTMQETVSQSQYDNKGFVFDNNNSDEGCDV